MVKDLDLRQSEEGHKLLKTEMKMTSNDLHSINLSTEQLMSPIDAKRSKLVELESQW